MQFYVAKYLQIDLWNLHCNLTVARDNRDMSSFTCKLRFDSLASTVEARTARETKIQRVSELGHLVTWTLLAGRLIAGSTRFGSLAQLLAFGLAVLLAVWAIVPPIKFARAQAAAAGRLCEQMGMDDAPAARETRSETHEGRALSACALAAIVDLHLAARQAHQLVAHLLALVGAVTAPSHPRLAASLVAGSLRT